MRKHSMRILNELKTIYGTKNTFTVKGAILVLKDRVGIRRGRCPTIRELTHILRCAKKLESTNHDWKANEYKFTG